MFVRNEEYGVFTGTPTNGPTRKILRDAGFVHVTGLRYFALDPLDTDDHFIGEQLRPDELGRWDSNNGMTVLVTEGGEVWLKAGFISASSQVIKELAPKGCGAFVPLSNGEHVSQHDLLRRMHEPNYQLAVPASSQD